MLKTLAELGLNKTAIIEGYLNSNSEILTRFLEMGLVPKSKIEILHRAFLGGYPYAIKTESGLVGLGKQECMMLQVEEVMS